jgi:hypothetical protein
LHLELKEAKERASKAVELQERQAAASLAKELGEAKAKNEVLGRVSDVSCANELALSIPADPTLPSPWTIHVSTRTGKSFWHNAETKESTWTDPVKESESPLDPQQQQQQRVSAERVTGVDEVVIQSFDKGQGTGVLMTIPCQARTVVRFDVRQVHRDDLHLLPMVSVPSVSMRGAAYGACVLSVHACLTPICKIATFSQGVRTFHCLAFSLSSH